jgi:hypothetical protein
MPALIRPPRPAAPEAPPAPSFGPPDPRVLPIWLTPQGIADLQLVAAAATLAFIDGTLIDEAHEDRLLAALDGVSNMLKHACGGKVPQCP